MNLGVPSKQLRTIPSYAQSLTRDPLFNVGAWINQLHIGVFNGVRPVEYKAQIRFQLALGNVVTSCQSFILIFVQEYSDIVITWYQISD